MCHFQIRKMRFFQTGKCDHFKYENVSLSNTKMFLFQIRECAILKKKNRIKFKYQNFAVFKYKKYAIFNYEKPTVFK